MNYSWTCPFCNHIATITDNDVTADYVELSKGNKYGAQRFHVTFVVCPNPKCRKFMLHAMLIPGKYTPNGWRVIGGGRRWDLIPESSAKPFPGYIPQAILEDYKEACLIKTKSPKASAALSRRCLQGMIRDFWGIRKARLKDEIDALESKVDNFTWRAIDGVRSVGNIGAHMEQDVNLIVDVEPDEAGQLITLIEVLLGEWYIRRHDHQQAMQGVIELAQKKEEARQGSEKVEETKDA